MREKKDDGVTSNFFSCFSEYREGDFNYRHHHQSGRERRGGVGVRVIHSNYLVEKTNGGFKKEAEKKATFFFLSKDREKDDSFNL